MAVTFERVPAGPAHPEKLRPAPLRPDAGRERSWCRAWPCPAGTTLIPACLLSMLSLADTTSVAAQTAPPPGYPVAAQGEGATTNGYSISRWAEDWRAYRDANKRQDLLDRLKYLPLNPEGDIYLTLSGEARLRMNLTSTPQLIEGPEQRQDILRLVTGADLHVGEHLRFYGELAHAHISGENIGTPSSTFRNDLVYQQYFAEAKARLVGVDLGVRYGRQEFTDGANLLISQRDNNTIHYVLNGVRVWARTPAVRITLFDFETTSLGQGGLGDDPPDPNRRFSGVSTGIVVPQRWFGGSKLYFDPFFWRWRNSVEAWGDVVTSAVRYYAGAHLWGEVGRLNLDWTLVHQWGEFQDRPIRAWQAFFAQNVQLGAAKTAPRLGVHVDYGSGGGGYHQGTLRNAYAPFGNNIYFSYGLFLTATNMLAVTPNLSFNLTEKLRVSCEYQFTWRDDESDAVYRANYTPYVGTEQVRGKAVAQISRAQLIYAFSTRLIFTTRAEYLRVQTALKRAGYNDSMFLAIWLSFRV